MGRTLGLISLLAALAIAGWLFTTQMRTAGPQAPANATAILQATAEVLELNHRSTGTYASTQVTEGGVRIVRADTQSYCVEAMGMFLAGPGGTPAAGSCG